MGDLGEFNLTVRWFLRSYKWRRIDPTPWTPLRRALQSSRLALVSTSGFTSPDQQPFDPSLRGGDFTYREIPDDIDPASLHQSHRSHSFDHTGLNQDPNLALPLDRVHELVARGRIGSANHRHFSFMGSITAPGRLIQRSAPEVAEKLVQDGVDVALLVPV